MFYIITLLLAAISCHSTVRKQKNEKSLSRPFLFLFCDFHQGRPGSNLKKRKKKKKEGCLNPSSLPCVIFVFGGKKILFQFPEKTVDSSAPVGNLLFFFIQYPLRFNLEVQNIVGLPWLLGGVATRHCKWSHGHCSSHGCVPFSL